MALRLLPSGSAVFCRKVQLATLRGCAGTSASTAPPDSARLLLCSQGDAESNESSH